eukprot:1116125-Amphidinium_carterae.1
MAQKFPFRGSQAWKDLEQVALKDGATDVKDRERAERNRVVARHSAWLKRKAVADSSGWRSRKKKPVQACQWLRAVPSRVLH